MKGFLGPLLGIAAAAAIMWGFVHFTVTDSPLRLVGFILALLVFGGSIVLSIKR